MMKRERRPMESYNAGQSFPDGCGLHHYMDGARDSARRCRVAAFWCAIIPGLWTAAAWAASQTATGVDSFFAWLPFALIFLLPIPSLLIARSDERLADQWDRWGHMALKRREDSPPADPPAPPPTTWFGTGEP
jgi:hypothetical protein